jgi:RNA polymerase sigma-70 factor (ECF subfamily)
MEGAFLPSQRQAGSQVATAAGGDRAAFTELVTTYQPDLLRVCYVILGDSALAEDAAQAAWMKAWRKIGQLRDETKMRSWLLAVAANEARQLARRRRPVPSHEPDWRYGADADPALADLAGTLAKLGTDDRRLLALRYVGELSSEQIGAALSISASAARHRLMRLLSRLKVELER